MNDIKYFQRFVAQKAAIEKPNVIVWSYTRVSSKDQFDHNSSVDRQMEANEIYAREHSYQIGERFGGTYESAKSDFTRKEFKRLIEKVESSRQKPLAVLVYKMSRFSRSGGNAIGLVNTLVEDLGVHLIEVCSGISTTTERGKAAIYESLFHAYKENLEKKEIVLPSMIASLKRGTWIGIVPLGYDHYGRKVRKEHRFAFKQRIEINDNGKLLREAWGWKGTGNFSDAQIIAKLKARGLIVIKQRLSQIWRNPFYCGVLINRLLEEPVPGNWPALVTKQQFIRVQQVLEANPSGFQQNKDEEKRPLTRLLKCNDCGSYMVGYRNKLKNLHYYRCLKCNGVSVNAFTTIRAQRKGANDLFVDFLKSFRLPDSIEPLVALQLKKLYERYNEGEAQNEGTLTTQLNSTEKRLKELKIRFGLGDIDRETYNLTFDHLNNQLRVVHSELNRLTPHVSNLEKLITDSLEKIANLCEIWSYASLEGKRRLHKVLFPEGVYYDVKNHQYLTRTTNSFLTVTRLLAAECDKVKNWTSRSNIEKSNSAPAAGLEPATL